MRLGATGKFPKGMSRPDDEGELAMAVGNDGKGNVHIEFGKPVAWFALPPDQAVALAKLILRHAGAKEVVVKL